MRFVRQMPEKLKAGHVQQREVWSIKPNIFSQGLWASSQAVKVLQSSFDVLGQKERGARAGAGMYLIQFPIWLECQYIGKKISKNRTNDHMLPIWVHFPV